MRLRTGHGPSDWSDNQPGFNAYARTPGVGRHAGGGFALAAGEHVQGESRGHREYERRRGKPVDMDDYTKENRWEGKPRCGVVMPQAGEPCARMMGHRNEHKTAYALAYQRTRRQAIA